MSKRLKVAIQITGAVIGSAVLIIAFLIYMSFRPFPVESLQLKEAQLYGMGLFELTPPRCGRMRIGASEHLAVSPFYA
jgi:hypothetical protein